MMSPDSATSGTWPGFRMSGSATMQARSAMAICATTCAMFVPDTPADCSIGSTSAADDDAIRIP